MPKIQRLTRKRLGQILVEAGVIDEVQLQGALAEQSTTREPLGEILVRRGFCTESDIVKVLVSQYSLPFIEAKQVELDPRVVRLLPLEFMQEHLLVPLGRFGNCLTLLATGVLPPEVTGEIEKRTGCESHLFITTVTDIRNLLLKAEEALGAACGRSVSAQGASPTAG